MKRILDLSSDLYAFKTRMRNKENVLWAAGSIHPKPRVSFANLPCEGVPDVLGRLIRNGRPEMDPGESEETDRPEQ